MTKKKQKPTKAISRVEEILNKTHRTFGKSSAFIVSDAAERHRDPNNWISTGSIVIDKITGGGYRRGRMVEISGPESSGKTTMCLHAIAECQRKGGVAAFVDAEHALDTFYAENLGVDLSNLIITQPDAGEKSFDIVEAWIEDGVDLIVIDSVAAMATTFEQERDHEDKSRVGGLSAMWSRALRILTSTLGKSRTVLMLTNQLRNKIGAYGNPETTTGGNAIKFYASLRLDIRRVSQGAINNKNTKEMDGYRTRIRTIKNKVAPPFRQAEVDIIFGLGMDKASDVFDYLIGQEVITRGGAWYYFPEDFSYINEKGESSNKFQGRDACMEYIRSHPEYYERLKDKAYETV
jgi:recombination protein RecA